MSSPVAALAHRAADPALVVAPLAPTRGAHAPAVAAPRTRAARQAEWAGVVAAAVVAAAVAAVERVEEWADPAAAVGVAADPAAEWVEAGRVVVAWAAAA